MRLLAVIGLLAVSMVAGAAELQYSVDSRQFQFLRSQQYMFVEPGNVGNWIFRKSPAGSKGSLADWQDHGCNVRLLYLEDAGYNYHMDEAAPEDGEIGYWQQFRAYVMNATLNGKATFVVLDDRFMRRWGDNPEILNRLVSEILKQRSSEYNCPNFIFRTTQWGTDEERLRNRLSVELPGALIGLYHDGNKPAGLPQRGWGFVIAEEACVPPGYRGQAMNSWLTEQFGQVPRMVACERPDFLQQSLWLSTGVSGIWFPALSMQAEDNEEQARQLRSVTVFFGRFSLPVALVPRIPGQSIAFGLRGDNDIAWAMQAGRAEEEVGLPPDFAERNVRGGWFNPQTDENILQPLAVSGRSVSLRPPSDSMWVYTLSKTKATPDTGTTITAIRDWQD